MSWQLGAFGILGLGLLAGFAWYERTRPDARIVALVGTLAAFAALGRIAFAAVPNVKPTSDIVLISGFALGGAPGYVIGAVAALTSNFFFGQGPWTPWQMAGWGLTGIAGALLARVTRRRIGRPALAAVSFVLGFAFTALQDVGDWVTYSDHSLTQLGVYVGKGLGFDLVHAIGCFGFAMLFGPALVRALGRFRTRIEVRWLPPAPGVAAALAASVILAAAGSPRAARAAAGSPRAARAASAPAHASPILYLLNAQNRDGGFGTAVGRRSDAMDSGWATIALSTQAGRTGAALRGAEDYLRRTVTGERGAGAIERTVIAAAATAGGLRDFGGRDLQASLRALVRPDGSVAEQTNLTAFWVLAMRAAGLRVSRSTVAWLAHQQDGDGGFNWGTRGGQSDIDDTGAVLQALAPSTRGWAIGRAVRFIRAHQNRDGGFGMQPGEPSNAQSTAFAVSGLLATRLPARAISRHGSPSADAYLRSLIQADGAVDYSRGNPQTPVWVTAEAQIALAGHIL